MESFEIERRIQELESELSRLKKKRQNYSSLIKNYAFPSGKKIEGVRFSATSAAIKSNNELDLTLIEIKEGSSLSGVFTTSSTRSSPVRWCQNVLKNRMKITPSGKSAILINSGNANTFTGAQGEKAVSDSVASVSRHLRCEPKNIFIASTGVIGEALPVEKIIDELPVLCKQLSSESVALSAKAIMTTDTFPKGSFRNIIIEGIEVSILGIAKGSGMISPDMATMLGFIFTDISIDEDFLQEILFKSVNQTFNNISVDGDTSTSDSVILAATGTVPGLHFSTTSDKGYAKFSEALNSVMMELSHLIVKDGEGATKFLEIRVFGAVSENSAKAVCRSIANSPLVKTAVNGEDPNWGRIIMAIGKSGQPVDRDKITIEFGDILVAEKGRVAATYSEDLGAVYMKNSELIINVHLGLGEFKSIFWTCDFSDEYVSINADYRS